MRGFLGQSTVMAVVIAIVAWFVLYPVFYLFQAALDIGLPDSRPPTAYGLDNFARLIDYQTILLNTLMVTFAATIMAVAFGFAMAWILTRTNVPFKNTLDQLMTVPYYVTPLLGALAWSLLGAPESGFINQIWRALGGSGALIDITSPLGIAWVMALFEGSVAYVMIGAVMQSMDPALEEASQMAGAGRLTTIWRVTLPLVTPGLLGATIFVFAEMLGSFSAALVLGTPSRFYVITTAIYQLVSQNPPLRAFGCGHGCVAVRLHVRDALSLPADHFSRQLRDGQRQGVPAPYNGPRVAPLGDVRRLRPVCCSVGHPASRHPDVRGGTETRRSLSKAGELHARQFSAGALDQRSTHSDGK